MLIETADSEELTENRTRQDLIRQFSDLVEFLNRAYHIQALEEWRDIDMTIPQIKTLALLENTNGSRMGVIAQYLGTTLSASTSIIDRLVEKGLVERVAEPGDRRVVVCKLTRSGRRTMRGFWQVGSSKVEPVARNLNDDQIATIVEAFELIRGEVEKFYDVVDQS